MYIQVHKVQREYLAGKPPFTAKRVEHPGGHRREGSAGVLMPRQLLSTGSEQKRHYPTIIELNHN